MTKFWERFYEIVYRRDIEYAEIQGALAALLWGVWFIQEYYGFTYRAEYPVYNSLLEVFSTRIWGIVFISIGLVQFFGLLDNRFKLRRFGAMSATILWLFVGIVLAAENWRTFSCPTAFAFALGSAWGFIRIGRLR